MTPADLELLPEWPGRRCRGIDPETFYNADGEPWHKAHQRLRAAAEHYCAPCPIRAACQEAGSNGEWGMWGGVLHNRGGGTKTDTDLLAPPKGDA